MHGSIVIARGDAFNVEAPVIRLDRTFGAEHHAGCNGRFTAGVTDVIALQPLWDFVEFQYFGQGLKACRNMQTVCQAGNQRLLGIGDRQLLPSRPRATHPVADGQLSAPQLFDGVDDCAEALVLYVYNQLARQVALRAADVVLTEKGRHDFGHLLLDTNLRKEVLAAQYPPAAHIDQMHTGAAGVYESGNHIHIAGPAFHALLVLNPAQERNLVTYLSGTLKIKGAGGLLHCTVELVGQRAAAPLQEHDRVANILGILLRLNQPDTRRFAALDLILQTRPRSVFEVAVIALTHQKGLLQDAQALANSARTGVRPEVLAF